MSLLWLWMPHLCLSALLQFYPVPSVPSPALPVLSQHINSVHVVYLPAAFFAKCNGLICSLPSCQWSLETAFIRQAADTSSSLANCNASLVSASDLPVVCGIKHTSHPPSSLLATFTNTPHDPLEPTPLSASACSYISPPNLESNALTVTEAVIVCPVSTVMHILRSVLPILT